MIPTFVSHSAIKFIFCLPSNRDKSFDESEIYVGHHTTSFYAYGYLFLRFSISE